MFLKVADRLSKEFKISAIYSSDLMRALETAQIIAKSCDSLEVGVGLMWLAFRVCLTLVKSVQ